MNISQQIPAEFFRLPDPFSNSPEMTPRFNCPQTGLYGSLGKMQKDFRARTRAPERKELGQGSSAPAGEQFPHLLLVLGVGDPDPVLLRDIHLHNQFPR